MAKPDFRSKQFWIKLRKEITLESRIGDEECYSWCNQAFSLLKKFEPHGFKKFQVSFDFETIEAYGISDTNDHWFLARSYSQGIFIADGAAGQINGRYPLGYYGYAHQAPLKLYLFYYVALKRCRL